MVKRVLNVGHCLPDHMAIQAAILRHFDVEVIPAEDAESALALLREQLFSLVLVNRKLDRDYSDGLEVIRKIKMDAGLSTVPVMLVTNFSDCQQKAVQAGAVPGFGKQALGTDEVIEKLRPVLSDQPGD